MVGTPKDNSRNFGSENRPDKWVKLSEIKRFSNFLEKIAKLPPPNYEKDHWEDDPVTEKQLKRLASFDLPIPEKKLTKGEASRLIDFYIHLDPEREKSIKTSRPLRKNGLKLANSLNGCPLQSERVFHFRRDLQMRKPPSLQVR